MYSTLLSAALLASVAVQGAFAQSFTVDTPTVAQCGDVRIPWKGGKAPFNVIVVPADKPCDDVLVDLGGNHNGQSITWKNAAVKEGTKLLISVEDATEDEAWTQEVVVGAGSKSCLSGAGFAPDSASSSASSSSSASGSGSAGGATFTASPSSPVGGVESATPSSSAVVGPVGAAGAGLTGGSAKASGAAALRVPAALIALAAAVVLAL